MRIPISINGHLYDISITKLDTKKVSIHINNPNGDTERLTYCDNDGITVAQVIAQFVNSITVCPSHPLPTTRAEHLANSLRRYGIDQGLLTA